MSPHPDSAPFSSLFVSSQLAALQGDFGLRNPNCKSLKFAGHFDSQGVTILSQVIELFLNLVHDRLFPGRVGIARQILVPRSAEKLRGLHEVLRISINMAREFTQTVLFDQFEQAGLIINVPRPPPSNTVKIAI